MLDILCQSVDAVLDRNDPLYLSPAHLATIKSLEIRLRNVEQRYTGILDVDPYRTHVAELYRLGILIYLYRVGRGEPGNCAVVEELVEQSFALLNNMEFCLRPWPLFVIALEAHTDDLRKTVLTVLEGSLKNRPLGSMQLLNRMIRDAWVQQDLHPGEIDPLRLYSAVINHNRIPPSFT
jgi:Fungal specific transcription factor domain